MLLVQAGLVAPVFAQFNTPEKMDVNAVKGKVLLVETQEEVTRTLMDLRSKPEAQQAYKDGVANFNQMMKDAVEKYFKWGKGVEYMPALTVEKLVRDGKASKYAILHYTVQGSYVNPADIGPIYGGKYNDSIRAMSQDKGFGVIAVQLPTSDKKTKEVYSVSLPVAYPSGADMVFAIQTIHNVFAKTIKVKEYKVNDFRDDITKYNKKLKKITLMIDKEQLTSKTTIADLRKDYNFPIEVVDYDKINDAVLQQDSEKAYVLVIPVKSNAANSGSVGTTLRHLVVNCKESHIMGSAKPGRMHEGRVAPDITRKEIKDYIED